MKIKRNKFDLSHEVKLTCDMGSLIPINCIECLPGDKFTGYNQALVRLSAQIAPVMHNVNIFTRTFFVPNRLLWKNWEEFITGGKDGNSSVVKPYINIHPIKGSLADYFGLPILPSDSNDETTIKVDALPFRAYNKIINDHFLDQVLNDKLTENLEDGEDDIANYSLQNVLWEKDYFTSARPSPQAGTGVVMPIGDKAPLNAEDLEVESGSLELYDGKVKTGTSATVINYTADTGDLKSSRAKTISNNTYVQTGTVWDVDGSRDSSYRVDTTVNVDNEKFGKSLEDGVYADLSQSNPVPIETLRNAFKIQSYLEKLNRAGYHMVDWLRSFFGVRASDARLQMSEYIGGSKQPLIFSEVLQTSEGLETPLGYSGGHSASVVNTKQWTKYCEEHGFLITLMYILPRTQYAQGLHRMWTRESKYDYYLPEFANLGEQAVKNKEIFCDGTNNDEEVFGYQTRFQEMRSLENRVCGEFRDTMKYWSMYRDFEECPVLNGDFVKSNPTKRIFATEGETNHCVCDIANYLFAIRSIPRYVTPATL